MKQGLWRGYWFDMRGKKLGRVRRPELAEAYRLWALHKDIREGVVGAARRDTRSQGLALRPVFSTSLREHLSYSEANPFHEETA